MNPIILRLIIAIHCSPGGALATLDESVTYQARCQRWYTHCINIASTQMHDQDKIDVCVMKAKPWEDK